MGIGSNIKRLLVERKMTIRTLSEISGISINTLYSITKRDSTNVNSSVLTSIASALDVSPFDLTVDIEQLKNDVKLIESIETVYGTDAHQLLVCFQLLNPMGKEKALEYLNDLTEQEKYCSKKEPPGTAIPNGSTQKHD